MTNRALALGGLALFALLVAWWVATGLVALTCLLPCLTPLRLLQ